MLTMLTILFAKKRSIGSSEKHFDFDFLYVIRYSNQPYKVLYINVNHAVSYFSISIRLIFLLYALLPFQPSHQQIQPLLSK